MPRLTIEQHLIANLKQIVSKKSRSYIPREGAYRRLKHLTGQDFGYDAEKWEEWFEEADNPYPNAGIQYIEPDEE